MIVKNTFVKLALLTLVVLGLSSCGHRYGMYQPGSHGNTQVHDYSYSRGYYSGYGMMH